MDEDTEVPTDPLEPGSPLVSAETTATPGLRVLRVKVSTLSHVSAPVFRFFNAL